MEKKVEQQVGVTIILSTQGLSQQGIDDIGKTIKSDSRVKSYDIPGQNRHWESFKKNYFKDKLDLGYKDFQTKKLKLANSASYTVYLNSIN
ncbi:MAG: permease-like cell division protein FtsX [Eubacterium ventriosum]|uniref:permease-like cell division protein FtsX n=1 Tax=Eubacterium ventriosum TaxID=39496 RepID=UPI00300F4D1A